MSLATVRAGLYTHLTASGPWAAREVSSCSFDVLEAAAASAITFFPEGTTEIGSETFGTPGAIGLNMRTWRIGGTLWIRDLNQPQDMLNRIWLAYDDLYTTFHKTDDLGDRQLNVGLISISHRIDNFRDIGGHLFKPVDWVVLAQEL